MAEHMSAHAGQQCQGLGGWLKSLGNNVIGLLWGGHAAAAASEAGTSGSGAAEDGGCAKTLCRALLL
jgi:hypothetical protein